MEGQISFSVYPQMVCCALNVLCFSFILSVSSLPFERLYYNEYYHYCSLYIKESSLDFWILYSSYQRTHSLKCFVHGSFILMLSTL